MSKKIESSNVFPGFRYAGRKFCLLNTGFDVEIGGMIYHLSSEFSGKREMGTVIEMIELERNQRNST